MEYTHIPGKHDFIYNKQRVAKMRNGNCLNCCLPRPVRISHINTDLPSTALSFYLNLS